MRYRVKKFFAVALGTLLLSACGEIVPDPEPEPEPDPQPEVVYEDEPEQTIRDLEIQSVVMKQTMKYSVWLPEGFNRGKKYPILYLLHGAGDDQNSWLDKGRAWAYGRNYIEDGGEPMIIVMPDAQMSFYKNNGYEIYFREELMNTVEEAYPFNGKRAVAGLSMGGFGTVYYALKYPEKFTYAYSMSPALNSSLNQYIDAQSDKSVFPPFTIEVGLQDHTVNNEDARALMEYMLSNGLQCDWIERNGGHTWDFWKACLQKALVIIGDSFKEQ